MRAKFLGLCLEISLLNRLGAFYQRDNSRSREAEDRGLGLSGRRGGAHPHFGRRGAFGGPPGRFGQMFPESGLEPGTLGAMTRHPLLDGLLGRRGTGPIPTRTNRRGRRLRLKGPGVSAPQRPGSPSSAALGPSLGQGRISCRWILSHPLPVVGPSVAPCRYKRRHNPPP